MQLQHVGACPTSQSPHPGWNTHTVPPCLWQAALTMLPRLLSACEKAENDFS